MGGVKGFVDAAVPTTAFLVANAVFGLRPAVYTAIACGVLLALVRLLRREPIQHAMSGFLGLVVAAFFAARTGKAEGFFLPGILMSFAYAGGLLASALVGRPAVGYAVALLFGYERTWRDDPVLRRGYTLLTLGWAALFGLRAGFSLVLYLAEQANWLAVVKLTGTPMYAVAAVATVVAARRLGHATPEQPAVIEPQPEPEPA